MTPEPSDERLNAFIDGELTPADAEDLLQRLRTDAALRERVGQLRLTQQLVRHAYPAAPPRRRAESSPASNPWRWATAASLVLGGVLGWLAHGRDAALSDPSAPFDKLAAQVRRNDAGLVDHVVLHVSSASRQAGRAVLDRAEGLLEAARQTGRPVAVEIVANSGGLDLLRQDTSAWAPRIAALRASYPSLTLVACGQTAQRLRDEGTAVRLLAGATEATSALDEIVLRMQQGWAYVRI